MGTLLSRINTLALLCFTIGMSSHAFSKAAEHAVNFTVEPQSWWAGMHNSQLQLLVEGNDIRDYTVKLIDATDVVLTAVETTSSREHLFLHLDLANAKPQGLKIGFYKQDQLINTITYPIQSRVAGSANRQGFSNKDVIYLITPDRFVNGDPDNDTQPEMLEKANRSFDGGRHGGDILGIRKALPYLQNLGVTQLWINPLLENNQAEYSYHGYSATDYYRIDPRFGSNQEYQSLVEEAKSFGIGVISDVVVNHIGSGHHWMTSFPADNWINGQQAWQQDPKNIRYTSHRRTTVQDPYAVDYDTQGFVQGWFTDTMPDLNQTNPLMATYLIQNSIWWIEYAGLSGIREDTYSYADKDFLSLWSKAIMDEYPNFNIVGEEWTSNPITVSYWQKGKNNTDGYQSHLPSAMDFPLYEVLIKSLNEPESWDTGFINLYQTLANDVVYANPENLVLFEGNHDTNRLFSLMGNDLAKTKMALTYVLTSNRIPQLFYGTEILLQSPTEGRHDGAVRADFPGGWSGDSPNAFTGEGLSLMQTEMLSFTKSLLNFRKTSQAIHSGALKHFEPQQGVYVQMRCDTDPCGPNGASLMIIYNKNTEPTELPLARFKPLLGQQTQAIDVISQTHVDVTQTITLPRAGVMLLSFTQNDSRH